MRPMAWLAGAAAVLASCVAVNPERGEHDNRLPAEVRSVLAGADRVELFSLSPSRPTAMVRPDGSRYPSDADLEQAEKFHDWKVLGRTVIADRGTRRDVVAAVERGIADSDGSVAACFNPRHGLRATQGGR